MVLAKIFSEPLIEHAGFRGNGGLGVGIESDLSIKKRTPYQ